MKYTSIMHSYKVVRTGIYFKGAVKDRTRKCTFYYTLVQGGTLIVRRKMTEQTVIEFLISPNNVITNHKITKIDGHTDVQSAQIKLID